MGVIRLSLLTIVILWLAMMYFGRDDGLPNNRLGREPAAAPKVATTPAAEAPTVAETAPQTEAPAAAVPAETAPATPPDATTTEAAAPQAAEPSAPVADPTAEAVNSALADALADEPATGEAADSAAAPATPDAPQPAAAPTAPSAPAAETSTLPTPRLALPGTGADTGTAAAAPAAPATKQLYVTGSRVNVRSGPSTVYQAIGALTRGTAVDDLGDAGEGWRQIRLPDGRTGYMSGDFLSAAPQ